MPTIKLLKRAELELIDSCEWYEKKQKGLSSAFRINLKDALDYIKLNPKLYSEKSKANLRYAPQKKFPYIIVYWYDEHLNTVFVTSIFHTKRNP